MYKKLPLLLVISGICFSIFCSTSLMRPASADQSALTSSEKEKLEKEKLEKEKLEKEKLEKEKLKKASKKETSSMNNKGEKKSLATFFATHCQNSSSSCNYTSADGT